MNLQIGFILQTSLSVELETQHSLHPNCYRQITYAKLNLEIHHATTLHLQGLALQRLLILSDDLSMNLTGIELLQINI